MRGGGSAARGGDPAEDASFIPHFTPAERAVRAADWMVDRFVDLVFILVLLIGLYFSYDSAYVFYNSRAAQVSPYKPAGEDLASLQEVAEDAIAWITLDDTTVDYPVMQGEDNYEYLNKDPFGKFALAGSIFLDSRNASDFSDEYSLVYGHHMSGEYMFGALDAYADMMYFDGHRTGTLLTERGEIPLSIIGFYQTDASDTMVFDPEEDHSNMLEFVRANSEIYREPEVRSGTDAADLRIVALTTCKSPTTTKRTVLFAALVE